MDILLSHYIPCGQKQGQGLCEAGVKTDGLAAITAITAIIHLIHRKEMPVASYRFPCQPASQFWSVVELATCGG